MSFLDFIFGRPLASDEGEQQRIGAVRGVSVFGLDALSSAAYGPEAALTILIPAGLAGLHYILPISLAIIALLTIVYFSYRQTIAAYPKGGGSYTVAHENLGARPGLVAAAALLIDYMLNVAVGISAGVGALVSAIPGLEPHTLAMCLGILLLLSIINLRGLREASFVFLVPTYLFVGCLLTVIVIGIAKVLAGGVAVSVPVSGPAAPAHEAVGAWLLLKAFASGCTALTGVEAVSNGVPVFREPVVQQARRSLTVIVVLLIALLAGIAFVVNGFHIMATPPGQAGYQTVLSQLTRAVVGKGIFYYITMASVLIILCFSANTSFADFPRVCRAVAADGYLPRSFANRGRRLVYSEGIIVLTILSGALLIAFGGVTDRLIPLFAIGAFMAFTLSQAGMVGHWKRSRQHVPKGSLFINGFGALATLGTVGVVLSAKFVEGAWVTVIILVLLVTLMIAVRRHYVRIQRQLATPAPMRIHRASPPIVLVPIEGWNRVSQKAVAFGLSLSADVQALHVRLGDDGQDEDECTELQETWRVRVEEPARRQGTAIPKLIILSSPYRFVVQPIVDHALKLERENKDRTIAVVIPQLVEPRWYNYFLHNQRGQLLAALLVLKGDRRIVTINVPWYLR